MACKVELKVASYNNPDNSPILLLDGLENPSLSMRDIAKYIALLPKLERTKLAAQLRAAKVLTMTDKDAKNHIFVSTTTPEGIKNKYSDLALAYSDLTIDPNDQFTIVECKSMMINGSSYYGRTLDSLGKEIFFINGYYGAQHFLLYLSVRNKINNSFENGKLVKDLSRHLESLDMLSNKYKKSGRDLILEFLNKKSSFSAYKNGSEVVVPSKILNSILYDISDLYNPDNGKTELQTSLESIKLKTNNRFEWKFDKALLYSTLLMYFDNIVSEQEFNSMNKEELDSYLLELFILDPKLMRARIKVVKGGDTYVEEKEAKTKKITLDTLKLLWNTRNLELKSLGISTSALSTFAKKNPEQTLAILTGLLSNYKGVKVLVEDGKITATYEQDALIIEKTKSSSVIITFPWSTIGDLYNFSYETQYLFSPVKVSENKELDEDGMYHGAYIYLYFNPKTNTTHYAVSRSIISPNSYMKTFPNLESALYEIDSWKNLHKINEWGLWTIKKLMGRARTSKLECGNISEGLVITVLNLELPGVSIDKMPNLFKNAFNSTVSGFLKMFLEIDGIELINTPEKAAAFIIKFYNSLAQQKKGRIENLQTLIQENIEEAKNIISEIHNSKPISYLIEELNGKIATLRYLNNGGNDVLIGGKFENDIAANTPTIDAMQKAINYFNETFNINIHTLSYNELEDFNKINNLGLDNKLSAVRAFIHNGEIYINKSNANISDLFHEMSHIFFGLLKVQYPLAYLAIMDKYTKEALFVKNFKYVSKAYSNFSRLDQIEEAVVDLIATQMFKKKSLADDFKGEEFVKDFEMILTKFPWLLNLMLDSGIEFDTFMKDLMSENNVTQMRKNMLISQLVKQFIKEGKIKEKC